MSPEGIIAAHAAAISILSGLNWFVIRQTMRGALAEYALKRNKELELMFMDHNQCLERHRYLDQRMMEQNDEIGRIEYSLREDIRALQQELRDNFKKE